MLLAADIAAVGVIASFPLALRVVRRDVRVMGGIMGKPACTAVAAIAPALTWMVRTVRNQPASVLAGFFVSAPGLECFKHCFRLPLI
ncbi:hypothetical protein CF70_014370 [Cupriavidus sp. SK-3]|nr:hypothetical protein CF70_014370 [Cupriavidus sp. SK-3]